MCGCNGGAETNVTVQDAVVVADPQGAPAGEQVYVVTYFNGTQEEVIGIDAARNRLMNPEMRAEGTDRDGMQGGTYARKR